MSDLVKRLRTYHREVVELDDGECPATAMVREAAAEIERLQTVCNDQDAQANRNAAEVRRLCARIAEQNADNERLREIIAEQRLTIEALNAVIGGPGSLTTDNLRRAADQPEPQSESRDGS